MTVAAIAAEAPDVPDVADATAERAVGGVLD
jgi:hypothetical protein